MPLLLLVLVALPSLNPSPRAILPVLLLLLFQLLLLLLLPPPPPPTLLLLAEGPLNPKMSFRPDLHRVGGQFT